MGRALLLVALVAGILVGAAPASAAPPQRVLVLGDSLVWEARNHLEDLAPVQGRLVEVLALGGLAACDYLDDVQERVAGPTPPDVVVAAFAGNNLTDCMRGPDAKHSEGVALADRWTSDAAALTDAAQGRPVIWVTAPESPRLDVPGIIAKVAIERAVRTRPNVRLVDGGRHISPDGRWAGILPCLPFEPCPGTLMGGPGTIVVRAPDGAHFCPSGKPAVEGVVDRCDQYSSGALRFALTILGSLDT